MITAKGHNLIARGFRLAGSLASDPAERHGIELAIRSVAALLEADNPRFKPSRFYTAAMGEDAIIVPKPTA